MSKFVRGIECDQKCIKGRLVFMIVVNIHLMNESWLMVKYHSFLHLATLLSICFVLFNLKFENPKKIFPTLIESNINIFTNDGRSHFSQDSSDNISILVQMPAAHVPDAQYQRNTKKKYIKEVFQTKRKSVSKECTFSSDLNLKGFCEIFKVNSRN